jgi:hypothetical protein
MAPIDYTQIDPQSTEGLEWLMRELPKAEHLILAAHSGSEIHEFVVESLSKMYRSLGVMLGERAQQLGYPLQQWEWPDSQPLTLLAEELPPGLKLTEWYQMQLHEIIQPTRHHLLRLV